MKLALISDPHLVWDTPRARLDDTAETGLQKFEFVLDWCHTNDAKLLIAGDLTHRPRGWYLYKRLLHLLEEYKVDIFAVFGQHDTYLRNKDATILDLLLEIDILDGPKILGVNHDPTLYGCSWGGEIPEVESKEDFNILVIHAPIAEEPLFPNHDYQDAKKFLKEHKDFELILCGDIHREFVIKYKDRMIVNTGPMLRITAEAYSFKHEPNFKVYDTETRKLGTIIIPHEPAEKVLTREHIERESEINLMLDEFVSSMQEDFEVEADLISNIERYLEENEISEPVVSIISRIMEDSI